jgi:gamma-glutamyltranspeptidase/glutathione hydrolase
MIFADPPYNLRLGGDLFAVVHQDGAAPEVLNASGRAGSGADPAALRAEGHTVMPPRGHVASVTVPGCVDGWLDLHRRFARLGLDEVLAPARRYADEGFPTSPYLAQAVPKGSAASAEMAAGGELVAGQMLRRPGVGRMLAAVVTHGRRGFYEGEFGEGLLSLDAGDFTEDDLRRPQAEWVEPLSVRVWGRDIWTAPPNAQGYVVLSSAWIAERLDLPDDSGDPMWAHLLVEAARQSAYDRPEVLHEHADGHALLSPRRLDPRVAAISRTGVADLADAYARGGTTYLCAVDEEGTAVSLIQSNGMSFGSHLVVGDTGVFLHNRGIGFSLEEGHPAEYRPGRRPPHTLVPLLVTNPGGGLYAVLGTRGGDSQPQVMLQLLTRLLLHEQDPATAVEAGRWVLRGAEDDTSFNTWGFRGSVRVALEGQVPERWVPGLRDLGHRVEVEPAYHHPFGHAQMIVTDGGRLAGAADPRALSGAVGGF